MFQRGGGGGRPCNSHPPAVYPLLGRPRHRGQPARLRGERAGPPFDALQEQHDPYYWSVLTGPTEDDRNPYPSVPEEYA